MKWCACTTSANWNVWAIFGLTTPCVHKSNKRSAHSRMRSISPPHVTEIDAEDALVRAHKRERIELEPRGARNHAQRGKEAALLLRRCCGQTIRTKPPRGSEQ